MSLDASPLPHNLSAERAVLGALLLRKDALADVRDIVSAEDFYRDAHQVLYRRMVGLADAGRAVDPLTLSAVLDRHGETDAVGGLAYVMRLVDGIPRSTNATDYAQEVRGNALRRQMCVIADQIRDQARTAEDPEDARQAAEEALRSLQTGTGEGLTTASAAVESAYEALDAYEHTEHLGVTGVTTGIYGLDDMLGGWQRSDLCVIAARPSVGKTAFVGQLAAYASVVRGVPTVFATNEQKPGALALRMASNRARVDLTAIRKRFATDEELKHFADALAELRTAPLAFYWARGKRMSDIRRYARMAHAKGACHMLVIDYLGLVQPEASQSKNETRERQVAVQSAMAKNIASELNIPVLLCCQLNREYERDQPKGKKAAPRRPRLSDLRESGAVEQDADVVLFVHRPFARPNDAEEKMRQGQTELIVAKQRNGAIGDVSAHFAGQWLRFEETT
jgi:replicative DNA helicase